MKKVMLLYSDGRLESKDEKLITKSDLRNCDYLMFSVSPENDSYAIVKPSKYLLFSKAIIEYQLCMFYSQDDYDDVGFSDLKPVQCSTTSMCDLIGLFNSIDRLSVINAILNPDELSDYGHSIGLSFFGIQLFDEDNNMIYESHYQLNGNVGPVFDPYPVVKRFKDIYTNTLISSWFTKRENLFLNIQDDIIYWEITNDRSSYQRIGMMLPASNTITLMTPYQYKKLKKNKYVEVMSCIYYETNKFIKEMNDMIQEGQTVDERKWLMSRAQDVYLEDYKLYSLYSRPIEKFVEIISHSAYVLNILYLMYSELYSGVVKDDKHDFDVILSFNIAVEYKAKNHIEFTISRDCILPLVGILNHLP